jgi:hypothetical protein
VKALVSAEPFPASLRDAFMARGIQGYQVYATADVGTIAYETPAREGLVIDEGVIVEIVRPGTGDPVAEGEVGEVVVTTLNPDYPLIRFGTGDLSAVLPGRCPTGRTNQRIRGWLGRADQSATVRGMFVHPSDVAPMLVALDGITDRPQTRSGIDWGTYFARQVLNSRAADNTDAVVTLPSLTGIGTWEPTPPAFIPYLQPQWAFVTPFAMDVSAQFRTFGPPPIASDRYARDYNEVKALGAAIGSTRTAEQTMIAEFWADGSGTETPPGHWN